MASASAPASDLAVQPTAASTTEAVDLSAGAAILEDPGPAAGAAGAAVTSAGFLPGKKADLYCCHVLSSPCMMSVWPVIFCGNGWM